MLAVPSGRTTFDTGVYEKALAPMFKGLAPTKETVSRLVQFEKAQSPISLTDEGKEISFKEEHPSKAEGAIFSTPSFIMTELRFVQL